MSRGNAIGRHFANWRSFRDAPNMPTPETLRELADLLAVAHPDRTDARRARAAADAWELKEAALAAAIRENADLYKRLEAAEKLVADTFAYLTKWGELGWMRAADEDEGTNLADRLEAAALAGEEKPDGWLLSDGHRAGHG